MANNKGNMRLTMDQCATINWMDRMTIVGILEDFGFACQETDTYDEVKQALAECIQDGSINSMILENY